MPAKKDVLVMQEAMLQVQARTDSRYYALKIEMIKGFSDIRKEITDVRTEAGSMHRQYWITFGGLIITIASVLAIN